MEQMPLLDGLLRRRYLVLVAIAGLMYIGGSRHLTGDNDWQFFSWGSDVLFGKHYPFVRASGRVDGTATGGLHLYANYAFLQIGPPSLLLAKLLHFGPRDGLLVAGAATQALGLSTVYFTDRAFTGTGRRGQLNVLIGGSLLTVVWGSLTHFTHLDDALTLASLAAACWALRRGRWLVAGGLLGLSASSKPWGVVVLALVLAAPTWRTRTVSAAAAAATVLAFWGPFVLADRRTLSLGQVSLYRSSSSALAALGVTNLPAPQTLRLTQFGVGLACAIVLVLSKRWALAPLAGFAVRLLVEPSAYQYYATGVVAAALIVDVGVIRARLPIMTSIATAGWLAVEVSSTSFAASWTRLLTYAGLLLMTLLYSVKNGPVLVPPAAATSVDSALSSKGTLTPRPP